MVESQGNQKIAVSVESDAFDPFLSARLPDGTWLNSDEAGLVGPAFGRFRIGIEVQSTRPGPIEVFVGAAFPGEGGSYTLRVQRRPWEEDSGR